MELYCTVPAQRHLTVGAYSQRFTQPSVAGLGQLARPLAVRPLQDSRRIAAAAQKNDDLRDRISGVVKTGDNLADGATDALAGGPRPLVKGEVVVIGGLLLWSLVKKALSLALFFGAVGGGLFLFFKLSFQNKGGAGSQGPEEDSPLEKARDIWNKYK